MGEVIHKQWQRPSITPHRSGIVNKFGDSRHGVYQSSIDGADIDRLLEQYGSPLFVLSERKLRENVRRVKRAFSTRYPKVRYAWSYKTNYLNAVCNVCHQEGAWAEVVSDFEYEKARALGVPGSHILFNGPYKPRPILERAVEEDARIHIDHMDELYLLEEVARKAHKQSRRSASPGTSTQISSSRAPNISTFWMPRFNSPSRMSLATALSVASE